MPDVSNRQWGRGGPREGSCGDVRLPQAPQRRPGPWPPLAASAAARPPRPPRRLPISVLTGSPCSPPQEGRAARLSCALLCPSEPGQHLGTAGA